METTAATDYISRNAKTIHDCDSTSACDAPAWWQDHCSIHTLVAKHHKNWAAQQERESEVAFAFARAALKKNPKLDVETIQRQALPYVRSWLRNPCTPAELLSFAPLQASDLVMPTGRDWKRGQRDEARMTRIQNAEDLLITYYHARVDEARRKILRTTFSLDPSEKAALDSYTQEAFMVAIREYDITLEVPIQPFLRRRIPDRLRDIIISMRPMGRPMRDYDISTARYMEENPDVHSRVEAAKQLGVPADRIESLETLHKLKAAQSLEWLLQPGDDSTPLGENSMFPVGNPGHRDKEDPEVGNMRSILSGFDEIDQIMTEAYVDGRSAEAARELGVSHARLVSRARQVMTQARERYLLFQDIDGHDFIVEGTALKAVSNQDREVVEEEEPKANPLDALTPEDREALVKAYVKGGLSCWAESHGVGISMAQKMAITLLEMAARGRRTSR